MQSKARPGWTMGSSGVADDSISWFNELNTGEAVDAIWSCCQSAQFAALVAGARPFGKHVDLVQHTRNVWWTQVRIPSCYLAVLKVRVLAVTNGVFAA